MALFHFLSSSASKLLSSGSSKPNANQQMTNEEEVKAFEKFRKACNFFHLHCIGQRSVSVEAENLLREISIALEWEIRYCSGKKCLLHLLSSRLLDSIVEIGKDDVPVGFLGMILRFFTEMVEIEAVEVEKRCVLLSEEEFYKPLIRLLETSKHFFSAYEQDFIQLASSVCLRLESLVFGNSDFLEVFLHQNSTGEICCPLLEILLKGVHLAGGRRGELCREGILGFLKAVNSSKMMKYLLKRSDLGLLASIALGAHFSQLSTQLKIFPSNARLNSSSLLLENNENCCTMKRELNSFLSMIDFCQKLEQHISLQDAKGKQAFSNYILEHVERYFLRNILSKALEEASEISMPSLLYYSSWIVRIIHEKRLSGMFLGFYLQENAKKHSFYSWKELSKTSFYSLLSHSEANLSVESFASGLSVNSAGKLSIKSTLMLQLKSENQECFLTALKFFSNCFCYHFLECCSEVFEMPNDQIQYCNGESFGKFLELQQKYLNLLSLSSMGNANSNGNILNCFFGLCGEVSQKILFKQQSISRLAFEEVASLEEFNQSCAEIRKNTFFGLMMEILTGFWSNSFAVNVALTELLYEILTCPIPIVYRSFLEGGVCEILSNLLFVNDFAIRHLSDSRTIVLLEQMRQDLNFDEKLTSSNSSANSQQQNAFERISFVKNYILLEEFTKEIIAILQNHALNFYGCYSFGEVNCIFR